MKHIDEQLDKVDKLIGKKIYNLRTDRKDKILMSSDTYENSYSILEKTAINMLKQKLDDSLIKSVTGFSQEALEKLKNKL